MQSRSRIDPHTAHAKPPPRRQRAADVEPRPGPHSPTLSPRRAKSRRGRSGTGTGLLLAVLLIGIVCAGAILSFGGIGSTLLSMPDCSGAALLHLLSTIIFIVALIPPGPALRQGGGAESALLLSGGALAALCASCRLPPVRPPSLSPLSSWCWPACAASASASASA